MRILTIMMRRSSSKTKYANNSSTLLQLLLSYLIIPCGCYRDCVVYNVNCFDILFLPIKISGLINVGNYVRQFGIQHASCMKIILSLINAYNIMHICMYCLSKHVYLADRCTLAGALGSGVELSVDRTSVVVSKGSDVNVTCTYKVNHFAIWMANGSIPDERLGISYAGGDVSSQPGTFFSTLMIRGASSILNKTTFTCALGTAKASTLLYVLSKYT